MLLGVKAFVRLLLLAGNAAFGRASSMCDARLLLVERTSSPMASPQVQPDSSAYPGALQQMNEIRQLYSAPVLTWNVTFAALAGVQASKCSFCGLQGANTPYAVNTCNGTTSWGQCVAGWFSESLDFDFHDAVISPGTADFINLIWNTSTQVGCGQHDCASIWCAMCYFDQGLPAETSLLITPSQV